MVGLVGENWHAAEPRLPLMNGEEDTGVSDDVWLWVFSKWPPSFIHSHLMFICAINYTKASRIHRNDIDHHSFVWTIGAAIKLLVQNNISPPQSSQHSPEPPPNPH